MLPIHEDAARVLADQRRAESERRARDNGFVRDMAAGLARNEAQARPAARPGPDSRVCSPPCPAPPCPETARGVAS